MLLTGIILLVLDKTILVPGELIGRDTMPVNGKNMTIKTTAATTIGISN
jgi:hypothetical protein